MIECNQSKICEEKFTNIHKRIDELKNETNQIDNIAKVIVELQTIIKQQQDNSRLIFDQFKLDSDKRDGLIKDLTRNIGELNTNQIKMGMSLDTLASKLKTTDENVAELNAKVDKINENNIDDNTIKINEIIKRGILIFLSSGITYYAVKVFGG